MCDARPLIRIHNMGSSYLDTGKITQYGWSGTTSTETGDCLAQQISSLLSLIVSEQTLPGGGGSLAGDEGGV